MTCAKVNVVARLTVEGRVFEGSNLCNNPQDTCPRSKGEDYTKCRSICFQPGHAEVQAIRAAHLGGVDPEGGHMVIYHKRVCDECQDAMRAYGISWELSDERF